jgi:hypothetical protein
VSNLVFPSSIGQDVNSGNTFGYKLPIKKTPSYKTLVQTPASNAGEVRVSLTPYPVWIFNLDLAYMRGDLSAEQIGSAMQNIVGFYMAVDGMSDNWLYFDPDDNGSNQQVVNSGLPIADLATYQFGTGDGTTTAFPLTRKIGAAGGLDLIQNWVSGYPLIYEGTVPGGYTTAYTLNTQGILTFNSAPSNETPLYMQGQFYFRCRFLDDEWNELQAIMYQLWRNPAMRFKSILL